MNPAEIARLDKIIYPGNGVTWEKVRAATEPKNLISDTCSFRTLSRIICSSSRPCQLKENCKNYGNPGVLFDGVEIRDAGKMGKGVFATREIRSGLCIGVYGGEILSHAEFLVRSEETRNDAHQYYYQLGSLSKDAYFIDGSKDSSGWVKFINHICGSLGNCQVEFWFGDQDRVYVCLVTNRKIQPGEELLYNYFGSGTFDPVQNGYMFEKCLCKLCSSKQEESESVTNSTSAKSSEKEEDLEIDVVTCDDGSLSTFYN